MTIRVLLLEDEPEIADFVVRGLREESLSVEHCADGHHGWSRLASAEWDVVVLDWWLPGQDGLTLLKRFRAASSTPVLFLTARDAVSDRVEALNSGADDYLCKPFAFDELLARVHALARRRHQASEAVLRHGDLAVHLSSQRAERGGARLNLTAKEYALLVFLLRNAGQVVSRRRIYERVWDECYEGNSNTLEFHVMELRRKLEAHGPRLIHTYRSRGYGLGPEEAPAP